MIPAALLKQLLSNLHLRAQIVRDGTVTEIWLTNTDNGKELGMIQIHEAEANVFNIRMEVTQ